MRLERKVGDKVYWLELKDAWTQRDIRAWRSASTLGDSDFANNDAVDMAEDRIISAKLELLRKWCVSCYLVDIDGHEYRSLDDVTPETVTGMDAPLYEMLHVAATEAFARRASLGEARGGRS